MDTYVNSTVMFIFEGCSSTAVEGVASGEGMVSGTGTEIVGRQRALGDDGESVQGVE
jgi:hypothetical protein